MPDMIVHRAFGQEVLAAIPDEIRSRIDASVFLTAQEGPDCWRYFIPFRLSGRSKIMHTEYFDEFINTLCSFQDIYAFSYCAGFICHIMLDRSFHEYIDKLTAEKSGCFIGHAWIERVLDHTEADRIMKPCSVLLRPSKPLPASLLDKLDRVYLKVYGWHNASACFVFSSRLQFIFLRAFSDSKGVLLKIGKIFRSQRLQTLSYYKKEAVGPVWETALNTFDLIRSNARDETVKKIVSMYSSFYESF